MRFNSLRFKISILSTLTLLAILIVFGGFLIFSVKFILYKDLDRDLSAKAIQIEAIFDAYAEIKASESNSAIMLRNLVYRGNDSAINMEMINKLWHADVKALNIQYDYFRLINSSGQSILFSKNFPKSLLMVFSEAVPVSKAFKNSLSNIFLNGKKYRLLNYTFQYRDNKQFTLQLASPTERTDAILVKFVEAVLLSIIFITLLTVFLGNVFADKILKPITRVIAVVSNITHKDLSVRIEDANEYDEIKTLINSFNIMIGRLETSFTHINEFSSHVAHELKTPLAIMKCELELALSDTELLPEYRSVLEKLLVENGRLIVITKEMLLLAKLDYDKSVYTFERLDLKQFFGNILEQGKVLAIEKNIQVNLVLPEHSIIVMADKEHLRRLFLNIINNAVKYTPQCGKIDINVKTLKGKVYTEITDTGKGISTQDLEKIFDKFFRGQKDESQENVGLGLNIALSIARAHRGDISVKSEVAKGSTFTVMLPIF